MMHTKRYVLILSICVLTIANGRAQTQDPDSTNEAAPNQTGYFDNTQFIKKLTYELNALHENNGTNLVKQLCNQLSRRSCDITLPTNAMPTDSPEELYNHRKHAIVAVGSLYKCGKCTRWHTKASTGFFVTRDGVLVTNYHVIDQPDAGAFGVMTYDGKMHRIKEVLAADPVADIAVLQLEGSGFPCIPLQPQSHVGSEVWVISHPNKHLYTLTEGIVSAKLLKTTKNGKTKRIAVTADFGGGSSGAPVFDDKGNAIAMVSTTRPIRSSEQNGTSYAQMVLRHCVPAELILHLFSSETPETDSLSDG